MGAPSGVYYAGSLSYADDITLLCPCVWGLNEWLKICDKYRLDNNIILTVRKQFVLNLVVLLLR